MRFAHLLLACTVAAGCGAAGHRTGGGGTGGTGGGGAGGTGGAGGSGGIGGGGGSTGGTTFASMCAGGAKTTVEGIILAPNGTDPVANAFAYVPIDMSPIPAGVDCELCGQPYGGAQASATSDATGAFSLDISGLTPSKDITLTINKGRFRRMTTVAITPCIANRVDKPATQLPSKSGTNDDIPKIAVSTGNKDELDVVLAAMGIDPAAGFDCYEGRATTPAKETLTTPCINRKSAGATLPAIETLLSDETKLEQYNLVFISCAPGKFAAIEKANPTEAMTIAANLRTWTGKGGRLFVTDNSYDYIAQAFPSEISFMNGNMSIDAANVGVGGTSAAPATYSGKINDATLAAWLANVNAIPKGSTTLTLGGYLDTWSVMQSLPMGTVDVVDATDAKAYMTPGSGTTKPSNPGPPSSYPQTVRFDVAPSGSTNSCGRAIYTSYHTLPTTTTTTTMLQPQERILEYLMFEATACLGTIG